MAERVATIYDYARFKKALCSKRGNCYCCPLGYYRNGEKLSCCDFFTDYTDRVNEIILSWCDEHPQKTYKDDFLEKFPNAKKGNEIPYVCRNYIYGTDNKCGAGCAECWNEEMPE